MSIRITIDKINKKYWINLITEAHYTHAPIESGSNQPAYDWQVCPKTFDSTVHHVLSGGCEWQCCGSDLYSIDLLHNLLAGRIAHEISLHYRQFLDEPREWLDEFASDNSLHIPLIVSYSNAVTIDAPAETFKPHPSVNDMVWEPLPS